MATYTDITINQNTGIGSGKIDGILFSSVNLAEGSFPVSQPKVAPVNSIFDPSGNQTNKALIINAVDIDWNGAQLNDNTINTTGELLSTISYLQEKVYALENAFDTLAQNVGTLVTIANGSNGEWTSI